LAERTEMTVRGHRVKAVVGHDRDGATLESLPDQEGNSAALQEKAH
jgi:hypothetical protein